MKFPYREFGDPPRLRPILDIELRHGPNGRYRPAVLVDTGSPITVFDYVTAEALVVPMGYAGAETGRTALLGRNLTVQFEYVELSVIRQPEFSWTARVAFICNRDFTMPFQGLLGSDGFLDKVAVTFNAYYDYFTLQQPDDAPE